MTDKILEVRGLTKTYGGVKKRGAKKADPTLDVLKGIDLDIYRGGMPRTNPPPSSWRRWKQPMRHRPPKLPRLTPATRNKPYFHT